MILPGRVSLFRGISAVLPDGWICSYIAMDDEKEIFSFIFEYENVRSEVSMLSVGGDQPFALIHSLKFNLMELLDKSGLRIEAPSREFPNEIICRDLKDNSIVFHSFRYSTYILHLSARLTSFEYLDELRYIFQSIEVLSNSTNHNEKRISLVPVPITLFSEKEVANPEFQT